MQIRRRVIPCLLLQDDALVKTETFQTPVYVGDPINAVRIFNEKEVDELIFLDITASAENREPRLALLQQIASECFMPLAYGGGIHRLSQIEEIIRLGVEKVCLNRACYQNPQLIEEGAKKFGSQSIVASIDVRKFLLGGHDVVVDRGKKRLKRNPVQWAREMESRGAGEILLTSVDSEGTMKGYDLDLIRSISDSVRIPVIAHGGAGSLEDFSKALAAGASAVAAGSLFVFHGRYRAVLINYPESDVIEKLSSRPLESDRFLAGKEEVMHSCAELRDA